MPRHSLAKSKNVFHGFRFGSRRQICQHASRTRDAMNPCSRAPDSIYMPYRHDAISAAGGTAPCASASEVPRPADRRSGSRGSPVGNGRPGCGHSSPNCNDDLAQRAPLQGTVNLVLRRGGWGDDCQVVLEVRRGWLVGTETPSYRGFRYPVEIISHGVWLYYRFPLSLREVQEMMLQRGIVVSHETIRQWCVKFGQTYANGLRRRSTPARRYVAPRRGIPHDQRSAAVPVARRRPGRKSWTFWSSLGGTPRPRPGSFASCSRAWSTRHG
ncbi:MAG: putative transposase [Solirubrobacteraceae bacterium]|nr:putative transposase [Solirubrobacteraceae bacterium]